MSKKTRRSQPVGVGTPPSIESRCMLRHTARPLRYMVGRSAISASPRGGGPRRSSGGVSKQHGAARTLKLAKAAARAVLNAAGFASGSAAEAANAREVLAASASAAQAFGPPDDGIESDDDDCEASGGEEGGAAEETEEAAAQDLAALDLSRGTDEAQPSEPSSAAEPAAGVVATSSAGLKDVVK